MKSEYGTFFLYKFWKSFVFLAYAAKTENDVGKHRKSGKPSFLCIGMTYFLDGLIWCMSCKVGQLLRHIKVITFHHTVTSDGIGKLKVGITWLIYQLNGEQKYRNLEITIVALLPYFFFVRFQILCIFSLLLLTRPFSI